MPHGCRAQLPLCLSDWIPIQSSPSSTLSSDTQLSKTGRQTMRHLDRQAAGQAFWGLFFSCCWRLLSAGIRLACSSRASAASRVGLVFSMETCPTLAVWLALTITRQTLCLAIQIIMSLWQDDSRRKVMQKSLFLPLQRLHSAGALAAHVLQKWHVVS